jgi:hypothetical protein
MTTYYKSFQCGSEEDAYQSKCDRLKVQYKIGQTYTIDGDAPPELCKRGYHACTVPINCFRGYGYNYQDDVLGEVELGGELLTDGVKTVGSTMKLIRILTQEEKNVMCSGVHLGDRSFVYAHDVNGIACIPTTAAQCWLLNGKPHRSGDKPAVITYEDGLQLSWYCDGIVHREGDKPAIVYGDGSMMWYYNGKLHRDGDKPSTIYSNGSMDWYFHNRMHRDGDKPAMICGGGNMHWFVNGLRHRDGDKPAALDSLYSRFDWYVNGERHREDDKPAMIDALGNMVWLYHDKYHRDGNKPAMIYPIHGKMRWYSSNKLIHAVDCPLTINVVNLS